MTNPPAQSFLLKHRAKILGVLVFLVIALVVLVVLATKAYETADNDATVNSSSRLMLNNSGQQIIIDKCSTSKKLV